jgi:hypothetical protein
VLLGVGASGAAGNTLPAYLAELFDVMFAKGDANGDGMLSPIELSRSVKGTALDGDAHAILSLYALLVAHADAGGDRGGDGGGSTGGDAGDDGTSSTGGDGNAGGIVTRAVFARGLHAAMQKDPDGATAQWILAELMDAAAAWETYASDEFGGASYYVRAAPNALTVWEKPALLVTMERCTALLHRGGAAGQTSGESSDAY